ncbi:hypothetical protein [Egbenema bharatensis]|uniref:hypothetical protein n=1 Tax=Egbenema bharatensis TaxID=3463334 RepID=UPI003A8A4E3A
MSTTPFLIPPIDRLRFTALYGVLTIGLWVVLGTLFSVPPLSLIPNPAIQVAVHALVTGLGVGVGQWWVLRSYLSDWKWIIATAIGSSLAALTQNLWYTALLQTLEQPESESFLDIFVNSPLGILVPLQGVTILAFCLWLAGAQWLVLRRYVRSSLWWVITPLISMVLTWLILLIALIFYAVVGGQFLSDRVLFPGLLGAVQALMLCRFHYQEAVLPEQAAADYEQEGVEKPPTLLGFILHHVI